MKEEAGGEAVCKRALSLSSSPKGAGSLPCGQRKTQSSASPMHPRGASLGAALQISGLQVLKNAWRGGWAEALRTEAHALVVGRYLGHVKSRVHVVFFN